MKIVVAPNAFKGCLTARAAAAAMSAGVARALPGAEIVRVPVADGGDGLVDVVREALGGAAIAVPVTGPLGERVEAVICHHAETGLAAVEMALASGLALVPPDRRDALAASTFGTGELIARALELGVRKIIVGIGGSATTDGGTGMAQALGVRFFDENDRPLAPSGAALSRLRRIDMSGLDPRLAGVRIEAACDVDNPLYGPRGAACVFGPQKGATPAQVTQLDEGLRTFARVIERDLGVSVADMPGAGAAGGLGAGLKAFLGAALKPGSELVLDIVGLDQALDNADLVLTGEGAIDAQTAAGKAPAVVAARARARGCACIAIAGRRDDALEALHAIGIDAVFSLCSRPMTLETAMADAASLVTAATEEAVRAFLAGRRPRRT